MPISILCAGGGARGIIQFGMLKAFKDLGLDYSIVYGSSVGALNAALYHQGDMDLLEHIWMTITNDQVYTFNPFMLWKLYTSEAGVYDSTPLFNLIKKNIDLVKLYTNPRKFVINTTDFSTWEGYSLELSQLNAAEVTTFIRASASPPIAFPPVQFRNQTLVDAGVVTNFSINQAINDENDNLIIFTPTVKEAKPIKNMIDVLNLMLAVPEYCYLPLQLGYVADRNEIVKAGITCLPPKYKEIKIVLVEPDKPTGIDLLDFNYKTDRKELIKYGYDLAYDILSKAF